MIKKRKKSLAAVILASGLSIRIKSDTPKQYFKINDITVLEISIKKFLSLRFVDKLIVVVHSKHKNYFQKLKIKYNNVKFILGSETRQKSSYNALKYLKRFSFEFVLIHDAARPFTKKKLIMKLYDKLILKKTAVIPVLKVQDSIKLCNRNIVEDHVKREKIYLSQTPQFFNFKKIYKMYYKHRKNLGCYTDDAQIFSESEDKVYTLKGDVDNIKITTKEQWLREKKMYSNYIIKVGHGYDTHKLSKGNYITLFGVKIPSKYRLLGHSDADVGIHAIIDSLLGATGLGDIGKHFPDTEKKFKGISSLIMLKQIHKMLVELKIKILHLDCTLVAEKPKISNYTNKMIQVLAKTIKIDKQDISIKATTTEGLGFSGRQEGLSCYCISTIKKYLDD